MTMNTPITPVPPFIPDPLSPQTRGGRAARKYPIPLLDEALRYASRYGLTAASIKTGVPIPSIKSHGVDRRREQTQDFARKEGRGLKYTDEQKRACVLKALELQQNTGQSIHRCFIRAGEMLHVNGLSIQFQWKQGRIR